METSEMGSLRQSPLLEKEDFIEETKPESESNSQWETNPDETPVVKGLEGEFSENEFALRDKPHQFEEEKQNQEDAKHSYVLAAESTTNEIAGLTVAMREAYCDELFEVLSKNCEMFDLKYTTEFIRNLARQLEYKNLCQTLLVMSYNCNMQKLISSIMECNVNDCLHESLNFTDETKPDIKLNSQWEMDPHETIVEKGEEEQFFENQFALRRSRNHLEEEKHNQEDAKHSYVLAAEFTTNKIPGLKIKVREAYCDQLCEVLMKNCEMFDLKHTTEFIRNLALQLEYKNLCKTRLVLSYNRNMQNLISAIKECNASKSLHGSLKFSESTKPETDSACESEMKQVEDSINLKMGNLMDSNQL